MNEKLRMGIEKVKEGLAEIEAAMGENPEPAQELGAPMGESKEAKKAMVLAALKKKMG